MEISGGIKYDSLRGCWCSKRLVGHMMWQCGNEYGGGEKVFLCEV